MALDHYSDAFDFFILGEFIKQADQQKQKAFKMNDWHKSEEQLEKEIHQNNFRRFNHFTPDERRHYRPVFHQYAMGTLPNGMIEVIVEEESYYIPAEKHLEYSKYWSKVGSSSYMKFKDFLLREAVKDCLIPYPMDELIYNIPLEWH